MWRTVTVELTGDVVGTATAVGPAVRPWDAVAQLVPAAGIAWEAETGDEWTARYGSWWAPWWLPTRSGRWHVVGRTENGPRSAYARRQLARPLQARAVLARGRLRAARAHATSADVAARLDALSARLDAIDADIDAWTRGSAPS